MYFGVLLEKGNLNQVETLELCRVVLGQGRMELVHKWLEADKLECSEELGDMLRQYDLKTAMQVFFFCFLIIFFVIIMIILFLVFD